MHWLLSRLQRRRNHGTFLHFEEDDETNKTNESHESDQGEKDKEDEAGTRIEEGVRKSFCVI